MSEDTICSIGAMIVRGIPPERVRQYARDIAPLLDELWIVEDLHYAGGISQLSSVLDATDDIKVGHGIAPAPFRNPAALAMEWATLARLHPDRLLCGLGHGVTEWMEQIGTPADSPISRLRESTEVLCLLLRGERVTYSGEYVHLEDAMLRFPPTVVPKISLGVRGPRSLQLAGETADGAILSEWSSPRYVGWARARIDEGRRLAGRVDPYRITVFVGFCFSDDVDGVAAATAAAGRIQNRTDALCAIWPEYQGSDAVPSSDDIMTAGLAIGTASDILAFLRSLAAAGADAVILVPMGDPIAQLNRALREVVPFL